ncbi:hypothetical protein APE01nite_15000 [Acetobacter peroxydans]|uniref:Uncharacterized protein n=1 Tax=Acetobacter peroxydans TaxID=104098 RepID=A0A4Y3TV89_9PROT|nr:hypothetical protein APE01nite_15000 [Acetobacter peroxydans]
MVLLPFRQDQVAMGAAILLMNDESHMLRVSMEFVTNPSGKLLQLGVCHGFIGIERDVT